MEMNSELNHQVIKVSLGWRKYWTMSLEKQCKENNREGEKKARQREDEMGAI